MHIHIFGASCSGVTTLGRALSQNLAQSRGLDIPYFDSDDYFWLPTDPPYTQRRSPAERNARILADLNKNEHWILGGSIIHWEASFTAFDCIVFLYLPPEIRMQRLKAREYARYGDIIHSDPDRKRQSEEFFTWAADYDHATGIANRTLPAHESWLSEQTSPILEIRGDTSVRERLDLVLGNRAIQRCLAS
jgi:adenylate kinase family enzyme